MQHLDLDTLAEAAERDDEPEEDRGPGSGRFDAVFSRVRRRIRGRVQEDLRHRINLAAARGEDDLFATHVENSLIFAKALAEEVPLAESVELYLDTMSIPDGVSDVIFNRALRTVADEVLPPLSHVREGRRTPEPPVSGGVPAGAEPLA